MLNIRKFFNSTVATAVASAAILAAAHSASTAQDGPIKVGVITDQVGSARFYAEPVTEGTRICAAQINENGGVLGRQIELVIEDDQNRPDVSASKARKLADEGVVAIISNSSSTATQQAQQVTLETETPHITPANSSDRLTTSLDNPWFFQLGPLGSTQIRTLMAYSRAQNFETAAVIADNSALSEIIANVFRQSLEGAGIEVVASEVIPGGSTTALPQVQRVRAANPDAIFQAGILGPQMVQFFQSYHQLGLDQPVLGSFNLSIPSYLTTADGLMDGAAFIDAYDPEKPEVQEFIRLYQAANDGETPFSLPGYGCDGIRFVAHAIEQAGSTDREAVRDAMASTENWTGVMGAQGAPYICQERRCFNPEGAVVRLIQDNNHGEVVHSGTQAE